MGYYSTDQQDLDMAQIHLDGLVKLVEGGKMHPKAEASARAIIEARKAEGFVPNAPAPRLAEFEAGTSPAPAPATPTASSTPAKPLSPELQATVDRALGKTTADDAAVLKQHRLYGTNLRQLADLMIDKGLPGDDIVKYMEAAERDQIKNARAARKGELKAAMAHAQKARKPAEMKLPA